MYVIHHFTRIGNDVIFPDDGVGLLDIILSKAETLHAAITNWPDCLLTSFSIDSPLLRTLSQF